MSAPEYGLYLRTADNEDEEVRAVLRDIVELGLDPASIDVLHTDPATYVPLLYELTREYDVPAGFARGVPLSYSKPGRSVLLYLDWLASGLRPQSLVRLMYDGLPDFRAFAAGRLLAAQVLRLAVQGLAADAALSPSDWLTALDELARRAETTPLPSADPHETIEAPNVRSVRAWLSAVLDTLPALTPDTTPVQVADAARAFLRRFCRAATTAEQTAAEDAASVLARIDGRDDTVTGSAAVVFVRECVRTAPFSVDAQCAGMLRVCTGGRALRPVVYILGLDALRSIAAMGRPESRDAIHDALAAGAAKVCCVMMSHAITRLDTGAPLMPSPLPRDVRLQLGSRAAEYPDLTVRQLAHEGPLAVHGRELDPAERCLQTIAARGSLGEEERGDVLRRHPHLAGTDQTRDEEFDMLLVAMRALTDPHSQEACRAFLGGACCRVPGKVLDAFQTAGGVFLFPAGVPATADPRIRAGFNFLKQCARWSRSDHPAATVGKIIRLLGLMDSACLGPDAERRSSSLRRAGKEALRVSLEGGSFFEIHLRLEKLRG
jgi:hypothetical protein